MKNFIYAICLAVFFPCASYAQTEIVGKRFYLPTPEMQIDKGKKGVAPLDKKLKMVAVIDAKSSSYARELEVWKKFIKSVDADHVGFVFLVQPVNDIDAFTHNWFGEAEMDYPFFYDNKRAVFERNQIAGDKRLQTFLLDESNKVVVVGASPITNDPFNLYRSELYKRLLSLGIEGGVKGTIIEENDGVVKMYSPNPVYVNEKGETVSLEKAREGIISGVFIPQSSPLSDTIVLVPRNKR